MINYSDTKLLSVVQNVLCKGFSFVCTRCEESRTVSIDIASKGDDSARVDVMNEDDSARTSTVSKRDRSARVHAGTAKEEHADYKRMRFMWAWSF